MAMNLRDDSTRPLVVRMGALGDMVMLTPMLKALYERTGLAADLVACGDWNRKLFANSPWVNKIYTVQSRNTPLWFSPSKQAMLKALKPHAANRHWFFFQQLPILHRLMLRANCSKSLAVLSANYPRKLGEHTCEQLMRMADSVYEPKLAQTAASVPAEIATQLHCSAEDIHECETWLATTKKIDRRVQKIVLLQAGNKKTTRKGKRDRASNIKYWPEQHWASLIDRIVASEPDTRILLCGVPSEVDLCEDIAALCQPASRQQLVQCAADLPLTRLMALASIADACISVDTGPAHIAAAVGCPLVVLFGQSDPRQFRPLGVSEVRVIANKNWQTFSESPRQWAAQNSMSDISVEQVLLGYQQLQSRKLMAHTSVTLERQEDTAPHMGFALAS
jgi:ADP-heptose:LPS heptosyltransferase